ncbi:hypothetical protein TWF696_005038 [Orbilia brochopaga]|uniref:Uncharacterized protein n=1 Tax=Orbilia brochopaga TaxID=3140254 RepID=A0AAV9UZH8_9PEZI
MSLTGVQFVDEAGLYNQDCRPVMGLPVAKAFVDASSLHTGKWPSAALSIFQTPKEPYVGLGLMNHLYSRLSKVQLQSSITRLASLQSS